MTTENGTIGRYLGWFLASLSVAAGVIHFAVAGGHFDVTWYHGTFFAIAAWAQLSWAAAVVVRPSRLLLALGAAGNALIIATWSVSRTTGMPFGPEEGEAESISFADGLATGIELAIVALVLVVLVRPAFAQRALTPRLGLAGLGTTATALAVVSTVALTPSFASDHHGNGGGHDDSAESAGHGHGDAAMPEDHGDMSAEEHAATEGHGAEAGVIRADGTSPCEESGIVAEGNADAGHGHRGPVAYEALDSATQEVFAGEVEQANAVVAANPTVADAEAHGYQLITQYVPCIGAHYINYGNFATGFDPANPEVILYDGQDPDSKVVGLSYLALGDPETAPEGFAGSNDTWHIHQALCQHPEYGIIGDGITDQECEDRGGENLDTTRVWMMHMWNVPGWDSPWGLFSSEHPNLGGTFMDSDG